MFVNTSNKIDLLKYDTIIFDLDFTLWNGCEPKFWAKCLEEPYHRSGRYIFGMDSKWITLQEGVPEILKKLNENGINLGFITIGGL